MTNEKQVFRSCDQCVDQSKASDDQSEASDDQSEASIHLGDCVVEEAAPIAAGAGARAIALPWVSVLKQEPLTRRPKAENLSILIAQKEFFVYVCPLKYALRVERELSSAERAKGSLYI